MGRMAEGTNTLPRAPKGKRAAFYAEPGVDQLYGIVAALAAELWAARERIDTLERLLERSAALPAGAVERFEPDLETVAARQQDREAFIQRVFQVLEDYA
jgi:hypothetical protein